MNSGIYKLTSPSGKVYIGQSWDIELRWGHYEKLQCKEQPYLYAALKKYPWSEWKKEILMPADRQGLLDTYEVHYIRANQSTDPAKGYNIREGGSHGKMSEESKRKMSLSSTGKRHSAATKSKISAANTGRQLSQEYKTQMSLSRKGTKLSTEHKAKLSSAKIGKKTKPHSAETLAKMSLARKAYWAIKKK